MSADPLFGPDTEPDNVRPLRPQTVPMEKYETLVEKLEETLEQLALRDQALARESRIVKAKQKVIDDLMDEAADKQTVKGALEFWRDTTKRSARTKISMSGRRADDVRWVVREFGKGEEGARAWCWAVVGLMQSSFHVQEDYTDTRHVCTSDGKYDHGKVETFIKRGRLSRGLPEEESPEEIAERKAKRARLREEAESDAA